MQIEGLGEVRASEPERVVLRMRGSAVTVSGWRIAAEAPRAEVLPGRGSVPGLAAGAARGRLPRAAPAVARTRRGPSAARIGGPARIDQYGSLYDTPALMVHTVTLSFRMWNMNAPWTPRFGITCGIG